MVSSWPAGKTAITRSHDCAIMVTVPAVMPHFHVAVPTTEATDLRDEIRRLFDELERSAPPGRLTQGDTTPPLDVLETDDAITVIVDLPGVAFAQVRVVFKAGMVIVAGHKAHPDTHHEGNASFHLVERGFGRFARVVRLGAAVDARLAKATLQTGELRLVLPKIADRRGRPIAIPIEVA